MVYCIKNAITFPLAIQKHILSLQCSFQRNVLKLEKSMYFSRVKHLPLSCTFMHLKIRVIQDWKPRLGNYIKQLFRVNIESKTTVNIPLCHYAVNYFTKINKQGIYERFATNLVALSHHNNGFIFGFMPCYCVNMLKHFFSRKCQRCEKFRSHNSSGIGIVCCY